MQASRCCTRATTVPAAIATGRQAVVRCYCMHCMTGRAHGRHAWLCVRMAVLQGLILHWAACTSSGVGKRHVLCNAGHASTRPCRQMCANAQPSPACTLPSTLCAGTFNARRPPLPTRACLSRLAPRVTPDGGACGHFRVCGPSTDAGDAMHSGIPWLCMHTVQGWMHMH